MQKLINFAKIVGLYIAIAAFILLWLSWQNNALRIGI